MRSARLASFDDADVEAGVTTAVPSMFRAESTPELLEFEIIDNARFLICLPSAAPRMVN